MSRLARLDADSADPSVAGTLRTSPVNIFRSMAVNPGVMQGLLGLAAAIGRSESLGPREKEAVMLRVSERGGCGYCLAAHTSIAADKGVSAEEAIAFRRGESSVPREQTLLRFVDAILDRGGRVDDREVEAFRRAGFEDAAIVETCAAIAWMTFTNLFNGVNRTDLDFPAAPDLPAT